MTTTALESLALGDSHYVDGNLDGAVDHYTAAICQTDSRRKAAAAQDAQPTTEAKNDGAAAENEAETKAVRFRSLCHRSEAYLSLAKYPHAYNDANAALALFPPSDVADDASSTGLRPTELALAHDRIARASFGLAKANMGVGARTKGGRVAFVKMSHPSMGDSEMGEEARMHWENALALVGMLVEEDEEKKDEGDKKKKKKGGVAKEAARLVEKFRKHLKVLDGEEEEEEEEATEKEDEKKPAASDPISGMMQAMQQSKGGESESSASKAAPPAVEPRPSSKPSRSSASSSSSGPKKPTPSDHPAMKKETSPVDRGVMAGRPKYQYYQDDNYMKIQILEPSVVQENLTVDFSADEISVKIKKQEESGLVEYTVVYGDLYEEVIPDKCRAIIKAEKVLIKLKKKEKVEWNNLLDESKSGDRKKSRVEKRAKESGEMKEGEDGEAVAAASSAGEGGSEAAIPTVKETKNRPYASHRDWNAIDRSLGEQLDAEKPEGDEALNTLFQQIYRNANEDTRRAMVKSMQTSGGTCLSTNWDEVEKTDYEAERQAPKGMEWKSYEGDKLPMKEDD